MQQVLYNINLLAQKAINDHPTILSLMIIALYVMSCYLYDLGGQRFFSGNRPHLLIIQKKIIGRERPAKFVVVEGHNYMKSNMSQW